MLRRIHHDTRGAAMIEFAIVAPVLILMIIGGLAAGHTLYVKSVLDGEMQKASRDTSLEDAAGDARRTAIQDRVRQQVRQVIKNGRVDFKLTSFQDYKNVEQVFEEYTDGNHNGTCDNDESFVDGNKNGVWDRKGGFDGVGGSKDVVVMTATLTYASILPFGQNANGMKVESSTLLRNQPSVDQAAAPMGVCK